ncbi:hypothetical protein D3C86_1350650 [compost metagenome]
MGPGHPHRGGHLAPAARGDPGAQPVPPPRGQPAAPRLAGGGRGLHGRPAHDGAPARCAAEPRPPHPARRQGSARLGGGGGRARGYLQLYRTGHQPRSGGLALPPDRLPPAGFARRCTGARQPLFAFQELALRSALRHRPAGAGLQRRRCRRGGIGLECGIQGHQPAPLGGRGLRGPDCPGGGRLRQLSQGGPRRRRGVCRVQGVQRLPDPLRPAGRPLRGAGAQRAARTGPVSGRADPARRRLVCGPRRDGGAQRPRHRPLQRRHGALPAR